MISLKLQSWSVAKSGSKRSNAKIYNLYKKRGWYQEHMEKYIRDSYK